MGGNELLTFLTALGHVFAVAGVQKTPVDPTDRRFATYLWCAELSADHLAGLQAGGACIDLANQTGLERSTHRLDIRVPAAGGPAVRVRHAHAKAGTLTTHVTYGGHETPLHIR